MIVRWLDRVPSDMEAPSIISEMFPSGGLDHRRLIASDTERIRHTVNVIEPGCNHGDLEDAYVIKSDVAQAPMIALGDPRGVARNLNRVLHHHSFSFRDRGSPIV